MIDYSYSTVGEKNSGLALLEERNREFNSGYFIKHEENPARDEVVVIKGKITISL